MEVLRKSSYMIITPLDEQHEKYMLVHGYTGAIDIVDRNVVKFLHEGDWNQQSKSLLDNLVKRGYLTTKTKEEEQDYVHQAASILLKRNKLMAMKSFTLLVTYDCNFCCPYCFEQSVMKQGYGKSMTISKKFVDKFFEAIPLIEPNEKLRNKSISLFGGEPLLKENKDIVEYIVYEGRKKGHSFIATSNGYDLDSYEDLLRQDLIRGIQITLDGNKEMHDTRRIHSVYGGSFDKIIENIKLALKKDIAIKIRINVDGNNINELLSLESFFEQEGLYQYDKFSAYAAYISGCVNFNPETYELTNAKRISQKEFLEFFNKTDLKIKYEQQLYSNFYYALKKKKPLSMSSSYCNARFGLFIFDPFGYIYSCLEVVGKKTECIGTYVNGLSWKEPNRWFEHDANQLKSCSKCKYELLCGGGCFAKALTNESSSYCDDYAIRLSSVARKLYFTFCETV